MSNRHRKTLSFVRNIWIHCGCGPGARERLSNDKHANHKSTSPQPQVYSHPISTCDPMPLGESHPSISPPRLDPSLSSPIMVHTAYDTTELVKGCQSRIDAVASHSGKLLLGCSDCCLRIYAPPSVPNDPSDHEIRRDSYTLERSVNSFWRRAPTAMEVSHSRDLLLSLSEWVAVHRLPSLESLVAIGKTKGANVFSWDDRRGFLCVGRQKRVIIYRLDGMQDISLLFS
jgi:hypothetical protein